MDTRGSFVAVQRLMKVRLTLVLWLSLVTASVVITPPAVAVDGEQAKARDTPRLVLETSIRDENYVADRNRTMVRWVLLLKYKNVGTEPILLYKKSSLIHRSMISRTLKAALRGKYDQETASHFIAVKAMRAAGFLERLPDESDFTTLRPGETHSVETEYGVEADGDLGPKNGQASAQHFIQVMVTTWYFYDDPTVYRDKWRDKGYLWTQSVKSQPMSFTIKLDRR